MADGGREGVGGDGGVGWGDDGGGRGGSEGGEGGGGGGEGGSEGGGVGDGGGVSGGGGHAKHRYSEHARAARDRERAFARFPKDGRPMQAGSIKTRVEPSYDACIQRLRLECHKLLSTFAFNFNLCRYSTVSGRTSRYTVTGPGQGGY